MRPRRLELKGFTAFRDPQVVDLSEFDLFVITGPTGAGKTSLLDALALALYGKVPRMGGDGLGQLVSHGQPDAAVLLEFAIDSTVYRVSRRLPRSGSQSGRLERKDGEHWVDAVERGGITAINKEIGERLVKLDFKSFCKAILLPQGEFAQFLKGDPAERRRTLISLLELDAYERMRKLAAQRMKELTIRGDQTRTILAEQFADATAETLAEAATALEQEIARADEIGKLLRRARELEAQRSTTMANAGALEALAQRVAAVQRDALTEVEGAGDAQRAYQRAAADRTAAAGKVDETNRALAEAQSIRDAIANRFGERETLARALDAVAQRETLDARIQEAESSLATAEATHTARAQATEEAKAAVVDADRKLEEAKAAHETARESAAELEAERDRVQRRLEAVVDATSQETEAELELTQRRQARADADDVAAKARQKLTEAQAELDELQRDHMVAALAAHLAPGDPCPVCERPLAEHPAVAPDVEQRLTAVRDAVRKAQEAAEHAQKAAAGAQAHTAAAADRVTRAREALATALGDADSQSVLESLAKSAGEAAAAAAAALSEHEAESETASRIAQDAALAQTRTQSELEAAARELELHRETLKKALADRELALEILRACFGKEIPADATAQLELAYKELAAAEEKVIAAADARAETQAALAQADEIQRTALSALNEVDLTLTQLRTRAEATLQEIAAIGDAPTLLPLPAPVDARELRATELSAWGGKAAASLNAAAVQLDERAANLSAEMIGLAADCEVEADDAAAALTGIETAERGAVDHRIRAETSHAALADRVRQRQELESAIAEDEAKTSVLKVLATELRADHFTEFVLQETLDALAVRASEELLRISDDRYSLVSKEGEFYVVDHINADEQRSVRTLSGGETFIASLSLALALSKHVTELAGEGLGCRLEAVFIDEGFGALDPESLGEVIDALERLREADLLVGVISHVPDLAERIGVGLQVRKDGNRSVVEAR